MNMTVSLWCSAVFAQKIEVLKILSLFFCSGELGGVWVPKFPEKKTTGFSTLRYSAGKLLKTIVKQSCSAIFPGKIEVLEKNLSFLFVLETLLPWSTPIPLTPNAPKPKRLPTQTPNTSTPHNQTATQPTPKTT